jgi:hypothetical protein
MTRKTTLMLTLSATVILAAVATPADAGGYVGFGVGTDGFSLAFGTSNWGLWGPSWSAPGWSFGFSATLSGYGQWVTVDGLGRVWRPWVAVGWQPYSHGRWVWTSLGWTWVAYEPWGWLPHHYGSWAFTTIGWVWTPGYTYHPGNVVWVTSGAYIGWYPCAPHGWSHAQRAYHHGWRDGYGWGHHDGYRHGYDDGWRDARYATWVPRSRVTAANIADHAVTHDAAARSVARSRITPMASPPSKTEVERMVGRSVPETRIAERRATVDGREIRVVRPEGQSDVVRRHGADTVKNALAPTTRHRAAGDRSTSTTRSPSMDTTAEHRSAAKPNGRYATTSESGVSRPGSQPSRVVSGSSRREPSVKNTEPDRRSSRATVDSVSARRRSMSSSSPTDRAAATEGAANRSKPQNRAERTPTGRSVEHPSSKAKSQSRAASSAQRETAARSVEPRTRAKERTAGGAEPEKAAKQQRRTRPNRR